MYIIGLPILNTQPQLGTYSFVELSVYCMFKAWLWYYIETIYINIHNQRERERDMTSLSACANFTCYPPNQWLTGCDYSMIQKNIQNEISYWIQNNHKKERSDNFRLLFADWHALLVFRVPEISDSLGRHGAVIAVPGSVAASGCSRWSGNSSRDTGATVEGDLQWGK